MRRMMTTTLDTISKIRMVLTVWLMVMRIARGAVFSVQMSFERFRIGTIYLKGNDIVTAENKGSHSATKVHFFQHWSKVGGRVKPMFNNLCCKFSIILMAFWQHKICVLVSKHKTEDRNSRSRLQA